MGLTNFKTCKGQLVFYSMVQKNILMESWGSYKSGSKPITKLRVAPRVGEKKSYLKVPVQKMKICRNTKTNHR